MPRKLTLEEVIKKCNEVHHGKYDYSQSEYCNCQTKMRIICHEKDENGIEHGEFWQSPNKHIHGQGCPKCADNARKSKKRLTQKDFEEKARIIHNSKYKYHNDYIKGSVKIRITCPLHGDFLQTPYHHLRGEGCPKCAIEKNAKMHRNTQEEFIEKSENIHHGKYDYSKSEYVDYKKDLCIICPEHGEFWQTPDSHLHGHGCPKCGNQISFGEEEIFNFIKTECECKSAVLRDKKILKGKELDIFIPEKQIAIEYNGLIWHSEKYGKDKNYHLSKTEECEKQGIRLIHIFEDEWLEHKDIVKSKIRHILGKNVDLEHVFARNCRIRNIKKQESDNFLKKNHIQGKTNASVYIGCFNDNELVGVMTFKKENKYSDGWELTRFASDITKKCIGIGGKMFKYFIMEYKPSDVKSFADRRWSSTINPTIYDKLGFKIDKILEPDYSYIDKNGNRLHKFKCRKKYLVKKYSDKNLNMSMTENEMTNILNLYKIWNCGLIRYIWKA